MPGRNTRIIFALLAITAGLTGCLHINSSVMFRTPEDYKFADFSKDSVQLYKIAPNDVIEFRIYTNDGFKLIDVTGSTSQGSLTVISYIVELDGTVKLPQLGKVYVSGLNVREAERFLETQYSKYFNNPFVLIKVTNKRVVVFNGSGGVGTVVVLLNENTTLIEALAQAGGITGTGKASRIKLIRGNLRNPQVQLIDLSTMEGVKKSNMVVQANDIIYVEPLPRLSQGILTEMSPLLGIITSMLLMYDLFVRTKATSGN